MAKFNMSHQKVKNQYIAGRDIHFGPSDTKEDIVQELKKLLDEVTKAAQDHVINDDVAVDVEANIRKATIQADKPQPDKERILDYLNKAKGLIEGITSATGLVAGIVQAVEAVRRIL